MSVLLFVVGALATMAGAVMVAFGVPINEFSFGNTLIAAGVTTFMGGLILLGLGAVVAQLQRVVEALAVRPPLRTSRPLEPLEQPSRGIPAGRIPFPPKPKSDVHEPRPADMAPEVSHEFPQETAGKTGLTVAPTLRNPDEPPVAVADADELPLSPRPSPLETNGSGGAEKHRDTALEAGWRPPPPLPPMRTPQAGFFETMWPAPERRPAKPTAAFGEPKYEAKSENKYEPKPDFGFEPKSEEKPDYGFEPPPETAAPLKRAEPAATKPQPTSENRPVAILKSGIVDGMGYTLYVDGSIEAELPQGTLRFASINELRSHLEKSS